MGNYQDLGHLTHAALIVEGFCSEMTKIYQIHGSMIHGVLVYFVICRINPSSKDNSLIRSNSYLLI
jgi:hypothetical protein